MKPMIKQNPDQPLFGQVGNFLLMKLRQISHVYCYQLNRASFEHHYVMYIPNLCTFQYFLCPYIARYVLRYDNLFAGKQAMQKQ